MSNWREVNIIREPGGLVGATPLATVSIRGIVVSAPEPVTDAQIFEYEGISAVTIRMSNNGQPVLMVTATPDS